MEEIIKNIDKDEKFLYYSYKKDGQTTTMITAVNREYAEIEQAIKDGFEVKINKITDEILP